MTRWARMRSWQGTVLARPAVVAVVVATTLAVAACSTASPPAPQWVHLRAAAPGAPQAAAPSALNWQLAAVKLPDYLDRFDVLTRQGAAGLAPVQGIRWAEPLAEAVPRALREDLAARLGSERLWVAPLPAGFAVQRQLRVEILGFEADEARRSVRLAARWSVADPAGGGPPRQGAAVIDEPVSSATVDALITAHRAALSRLAERIAAP